MEFLFHHSLFRNFSACVFGYVTGPVAFNYEKEPEVLKIDGKSIAIAHNLGQTARLLDEVRSGESRYDIIRLCA